MSELRSLGSPACGGAASTFLLAFRLFFFGSLLFGGAAADFFVLDGVDFFFVGIASGCLLKPECRRAEPVENARSASTGCRVASLEEALRAFRETSARA